MNQQAFNLMLKTAVEYGISGTLAAAIPSASVESTQPENMWLRYVSSNDLLLVEREHYQRLEGAIRNLAEELKSRELQESEADLSKEDLNDPERIELIKLDIADIAGLKVEDIWPVNKGENHV